MSEIVKRTAWCDNDGCGEVTFKASPYCGGVKLNCTKCEKEAYNIEISQYSSISHNCINCGGETFKAKVMVENDIKYFTIICKECNTEVPAIYVDQNCNEISELEREMLIRAHYLEKCNHCGSEEIKIISNCGKAKFICNKCSTMVGSIDFDRYETLKNTCICGNDVFDVEVVEEFDGTYDIPRCKKCFTEVEKCYVDSNNIEIDRFSKEILIIKDSINALESEVNTLKYASDKMEFQIRNHNYSMEDLESKIYYAKDDINELKKQLTTLEWKIDKL